jgi:hypothetical protein
MGSRTTNIKIPVPGINHFITPMRAGKSGPRTFFATSKGLPGPKKLLERLTANSGDALFGKLSPMATQTIYLGHYGPYFNRFEGLQFRYCGPAWELINTGKAAINRGLIFQDTRASEPEVSQSCSTGRSVTGSAPFEGKEKSYAVGDISDTTLENFWHVQRSNGAPWWIRRMLERFAEGPGKRDKGSPSWVQHIRYGMQSAHVKQRSWKVDGGFQLVVEEVKEEEYSTERYKKHFLDRESGVCWQAKIEIREIRRLGIPTPLDMGILETARQNEEKIESFLSQNPWLLETAGDEEEVDISLGESQFASHLREWRMYGYPWRRA